MAATISRDEHRRAIDREYAEGKDGWRDAGLSLDVAAATAGSGR